MNNATGKSEPEKYKRIKKKKNKDDKWKNAIQRKKSEKDSNAVGGEGEEPMTPGEEEDGEVEAKAHHRETDH